MGSRLRRLRARLFMGRVLLSGLLGKQRGTGPDLCALDPAELLFIRTHGENIPTANRNQRIITTKQPVGVVGCLTPWNFPLAMITRKACAGIVRRPLPTPLP